MSKLLLLFAGLFSIPAAHSQEITTIATQWSDSYKEWIIYTDDEDITGVLQLRWPARDDWTSWTYQVGDHYGTIHLKWQNDPSQWELRGENEIITARTIWRNDFSAWNCYDGNTKIKWKSTYKTPMDEWLTDTTTDSLYLSIYTAWEGDSREWIIEAAPESTLSFPYKMMLAFIAIYHSSG